MAKTKKSDNSEKKSRSTKPPDPLRGATVSELLQFFDIKDWDALLVGDGSGTGWDEPCGWATVLHDRYSSMRKLFLGAMNHGTNYIAELMPYLQALLWYVHGPGRKRRADLYRTQPGAMVIIHIVTDAEIIAAQGNGQAGKHENRELWVALDAFAARGYKLIWHHAGRDRLGLNMLTDHLSRQERLTMTDLIQEAIEKVKAVRPPDQTTIYDYNPASDS